MKKELMQVYICEHCKRKMFSPGAMGLHEKQCKENPKNKHKCFQWCKYLVKGANNPDRELNLHTNFTCKLQPALGELYSYKLERFTCHTDAIKTMRRMPLECDLYQYSQGEDDLISNDFDW